MDFATLLYFVPEITLTLAVVSTVLPTIVEKNYSNIVSANTRLPFPTDHAMIKKASLKVAQCATINHLNDL